MVADEPLQAAGDERFPCRLRMTKQKDFARVHRENVFAADPTLVVRGSTNHRNYPRLGLSVSRKVGHAPLRNRWKRLIREAFRKIRRELPGGYDFVVRPRRGAEPSLPAIAASLPNLTRRIAVKWERKKK
ncbi:MAG: ribonuclease P protein component [Planctomycetaceae bacterium]|nr:ribonuclease P protein component [Planctomycetaceae bacterium]